MGEQALPYAVGRRRQVVLEVLRLITKLDMRSVEAREVATLMTGHLLL